MAEKKLLVADDSLTIQKVIRLALSNEGYEIQTVSDGHDAVQQISLFRPNIVLIDISLPGKSAFEVKREINNFQDFEEIRFVLMSSAFEKVDEVQMKEVGFHGNLTKPFDPSHLRQILLDALSQITKKRAEKTTILSKSGTLSHPGPGTSPTVAPPQRTSPPPASGVREIETPLPPETEPDFGVDQDTPEEGEPLETDLWDVGQDPATLSSLPSIPEPEEPETTYAAPVPKKPTAPPSSAASSFQGQSQSQNPANRTGTQKSIPQDGQAANRPSGNPPSQSPNRTGTLSSTAAPPAMPTPPNQVQAPQARPSLATQAQTTGQTKPPLANQGLGVRSNKPPAPSPAPPTTSRLVEGTSSDNRTGTLPLGTSAQRTTPPPAKIKYPQREEKSAPTQAPTSMPEPMARPFSQQPWQSGPQPEGTMDLPEIKTEETQYPIGSPTMAGPTGEEKDIQELTSSTFLMNNASDFQWNVNEPTLRPTGQLANSEDTEFEIDSTEPLSHIGQLDTALEPSLAAPVLDSQATENDPTPIFDPPTSPDFGLSDPNLVNPLDPTATAAHSTSFSQSQIELLVRQEVQNLVEKTVRTLIPELAEKLIKEEIHRILSDS